MEENPKVEPDNSAHTDDKTRIAIDAEKYATVPAFSGGFKIHADKRIGYIAGALNELKRAESLRKENEELKFFKETIEAVIRLNDSAKESQIEQLKKDKAELLTTLIFAVDELPEITDMYPQVADVIQKHTKP